MSQWLQLMFLSMHGNCIELKKKNMERKTFLFGLKRMALFIVFVEFMCFLFWWCWLSLLGRDFQFFFFFKIIIIFFFVFSRKEDWIMENYCLWLGLIWHYLMHFVGWWRRIFLFLIHTLWIILSFNSVKGVHIDK